MKTYTHNGVTIRKDYDRYELVGYTWGDRPGETFRFKTLKAAKDFIDRTVATGNLYSQQTKG